MADYWITVQIDPQRTRDIRVDADNYMEFARGTRGRRYKVIAVRPCNKDHSQTD
jgi:hypothetical protein